MARRQNLPAAAIAIMGNKQERRSEQDQWLGGADNLSISVI
jgi:hypothetical protein